MEIDLELYRQDVRLPTSPPVWLSVIDISPEHPQRTLVFLHGFGGNATQWQYQLERFSVSDRVIAVDLRGHGHSARPDGRYRMEQLVSDLTFVLDSLQVVEPFILVAHSFGGAVASEYVLRHPERVAKLVLIATASEFELNRIYRFFLSLPLPVLRVLFLIAGGRVGAPPHVLKPWYSNTLSTWRGWDLFRRLPVPTLVIRGHLDRVFRKPLYEEVAKVIPDVEEVDVGASGHLVMLERRDAVNRAIARFLNARQGSERMLAGSDLEDERDKRLRERPWLPYYDEGVPDTIAVPSVPLHYLLDSAARRFPGRTAIIFEGNRVTYRRLAEEANRFANALIRLGVRKGDRVMLIMPNVPQMVISFYGTLKAGGTAVLSQPATSQVELVRQIQDSGAKVLVTITQFDELIYEIKNQLEPLGNSPLEHVIFTHIADYLPLPKRLLLLISAEQRKRHMLDIPLGAGMHTFIRLLYMHSKEPPELQSAPGDVAVVAYTGGTTDRPKGVMLSHRNLMANALQTRHWMPDAQEGQERFLCVLPFSHSYGLTAALNVPVALGATLILKATFQVEDTLETIAAHRPTIFPGVPQMYIAIEDFPGVRRYGIQSIKACISGSAPLPVEVQEAFERLTRGRLVEGYGLTEASPVTHANPLTGMRKVGTIGIPLPSTEARVVDLLRSEREAPLGQVGELAVRGPQVMVGYWQDPKATRQAITRDGWLLTGDVAQQDRDGYFRIVARKADLWYPSKPGKPAFPRDVEEVLVEVPQVKEAVVVAIAGQPVAFVIPKKDKPTAELLIAYCKRRLPPELVPRLIIFVEDFPRTFIGKVLRRELSQRLEASQRSETGVDYGD